MSTFHPFDPNCKKVAKKVVKKYFEFPHNKLFGAPQFGHRMKQGTAMFSREGKIKSIEFQILDKNPPQIFPDSDSSSGIDLDQMTSTTNLGPEIQKRK